MWSSPLQRTPISITNVLCLVSKKTRGPIRLVLGASGIQETEPRCFLHVIKRLMHTQAARKEWRWKPKQKRWILQNSFVNEVVEKQALTVHQYIFLKIHRELDGITMQDHSQCITMIQITEPYGPVSFSTVQDSRTGFYSDYIHQSLYYAAISKPAFTAVEFILPFRNSFSKFHPVPPGLALTLTQQV